MIPDLQEFSAEQDLKQINYRLMRQLEKERESKEDLILAVRQAATDAISTLVLPSTPAPALKPSESQQRGKKHLSETAIAVLSDWQLGKSTPTYSSEICEQRMAQYGEKVLELANIQRSHHPVDELRVYLLGDLVEGEMIFPGQAHRIDASLFRQVLVDGPRILSTFLRTMLANFERVRVVGVIGNHGAIGGRARKEMHPESNADSMMYEATRLLLEKEKRLEWVANWTPNERNWYAVDKVGDKSFFLFHGDQVRGGFAGHPWYGFSKRLQAWRNGVVEPFDFALSGHFHTPVRMFLNTITHWGNGSTESTNTYAAEELSAAGRPCQWLLFSHPKRGVSAEYLVALD